MAYSYDTQHLNGLDQRWAVDLDDHIDAPGGPSDGAWYAACSAGYVYRCAVGTAPLVGPVLRKLC